MPALLFPPAQSNLDGVQVSGTPSAGQILTATSATAADWASPAVIDGITVSGSAAAGQALIATSSSAASWATIPNQGPQPSDQNLIAWTYDPVIPGASTAPTGGQVQLMKVIIRLAATVTNVILHIPTIGNTLTTNENFAGLYGSTGTLLSATADQTAAWGSTGLKTMALSAAQAVTAGIYYIGFVANGSTTPSFARGAGLTSESTLLNVGVTAATARFATSGVSITTLANVTMSGNGLATVGFWGALS